MADNSKIEWTDATWNIITGCSPVSPGCANCYASRLAGTRLKHHPSRAGLTKEVNGRYVWNGEVCFSLEWLDQPIRWKKPRKVFVCAHGDLFHENVPDDWIDAVFGVMWACLYGRDSEPGHIFQILTKRADRMLEYLSQDRREQWATNAVNYGGGLDPDGLYDQTKYFDGPHPRIWAGVTVENQEMADKRIPLLLATPAAKRFISMEPLIGSVDIVHAFDWPAPGVCIDWVIVGGESGQNARPMHPDWVRTVRDQCAIAHVPFMFKQWGEWCPRSDCVHKFEDGSCLADLDPSCKKWPYVVRLTARGNDGSRLENSCDGDDTYMQKVGKKIAGRLLDGRTWDEVPE
ncbi:DUF5131 family protein [Oxalobacter formigenes]|uniref:DUF5131 family protein n=1 Tax=Oxalobacter formigenes TaxID=847 RepID=UPI000A2A2A42|nr:phage Gp37/Gp68 family protein [Oxalobacter formigenes]ARQ46111.1 Phage protein Gp37/Gp68 [Oxalobacter formigenes]MCZ4062688.1 phage Gp37/Gp68 family protein [Oxalobacter formigenes]QDX33155.1 phage Gp37/Gp68 family protein [Oxalobacter formigenes]